MVATPVMYRAVGIAALRVRRNWRGKLIVQVCDKVQACRGIGDWQNAGSSPWRDARANDSNEVAAVVAMMQKSIPQP